MRIVKLIAAVLGGLGVSVGSGSGVSAQEQDPLQCEQILNEPGGTFNYIQEAECACEDALLAGTEEALLEFLNKYPGAPTACLARAQNALQDRDPFTDFGYGG